MQQLHVSTPASWLLRILPIIAMVLGGCASSDLPTFQQDAGILFWHDWSGNDAVLLGELLDNFHQIQPDLTVINAELAPAKLAQDFIHHFDEGLEPDLVLTDARTAQDLIRQGMVKELSAYGIKPNLYSSAALSMVSDGDKVYALPFALSTQLLFYNKNLVPAAPATLEDLRQLTLQPEIAMGLNTSFLEAYWGLRAFGGRTYDDGGHFTLDQGALTNWLTALTTIQGAAGFVLSDNQEQLRQQFIDGDIALYVADAAEVGELSAALGDALGIAPLPIAENGNPAGPLLQASVLLISANAGENETAEALKLAQFLTNSQQQSLLTVSDIGHLSAVNTVYLSPSLPDIVVQLATQLSSAVPIRLDQRAVWDAISERGQTLYRGVMEGLLDEQAAASELVAYVAELHQQEAGPAATVPCPALGSNEPLTLTVWHSWSEVETTVLEQLADDFHTLCPSIAISLTQVSNSTTLNTRFRTAAQAGGGPHVLIGSTQWMAQWAEDGLIRPLDNDTQPGELAAYIPAAVNAVQYDELLYAYPESVRSVALIYNPALVETPPKTLHELLLQVDSEHPLAMPLTFFYAYWGLGAYGGQIAGEDDNLYFDQAAAVEWLQWLRAAARRPGFYFTRGRAEAEYLFLKREAAFLVSGPWSLPRLAEALPAGEVAVALLPSGPSNRASPILEVEGVMLNAGAVADAVTAGLAFARFLSSASSAEALVATGVHVPANVTASLAQTSLIESLSDQAQMGTGIVQDSRWLEVFAAGDALYADAVLGDADVQAAVAAFADVIGRLPSSHDAAKNTP